MRLNLCRYCRLSCKILQKMQSFWMSCHLYRASIYELVHINQCTSSFLSRFLMVGTEIATLIVIFKIKAIKRLNMHLLNQLFSAPFVRLKTSQPIATLLCHSFFLKGLAKNRCVRTYYRKSWLLSKTIYSE